MVSAAKSKWPWALSVAVNIEAQIKTQTNSVFQFRQKTNHFLAFWSNICQGSVSLEKGENCNNSPSVSNDAHDSAISF